MTRSLFIFLPVILALMFTPEFAHACKCMGGESGFLYETGTTLPQNVVGVPWSGGRYVSPNETLFRVERVTTKNPENIAFDIRSVDGPLALISPKSGFKSGSRYRFTYFRRASGWETPSKLEKELGIGAGAKPQVIEIRIAKEGLSQPQKPSMIQVGKSAITSLGVETTAGMCSTTIQAATREVTFNLPRSLSKWKNAFLYSLSVDGNQWKPKRSMCQTIPPGRSWEGIGQDLLFSRCDKGFAKTGGLSPGKHQVEMSAWLPGTDFKYISTEQVEIQCPQ